jgi:hypothetical protein
LARCEPTPPAPAIIIRIAWINVEFEYAKLTHKISINIISMLFCGMKRDSASHAFISDIIMVAGTAASIRDDQGWPEYLKNGIHITMYIINQYQDVCLKAESITGVIVRPVPEYHYPAFPEDHITHPDPKCIQPVVSDPGWIGHLNGSIRQEDRRGKFVPDTKITQCVRDLGGFATDPSSSVNGMISLPDKADGRFSGNGKNVKVMMGLNPVFTDARKQYKQCHCQHQGMNDGRPPCFKENPGLNARQVKQANLNGLQGYSSGSCTWNISHKICKPVEQGSQPFQEDGRLIIAGKRKKEISQSGIQDDGSQGNHPKVGQDKYVGELVKIVDCKGCCGHLGRGGHRYDLPDPPAHPAIEPDHPEQWLMKTDDPCHGCKGELKTRLKYHCRPGKDH